MSICTYIYIYIDIYIYLYVYIYIHIHTERDVVSFFVIFEKVENIVLNVAVYIEHYASFHKHAHNINSYYKHTPQNIYYSQTSTSSKTDIHKN